MTFVSPRPSDSIILLVICFIGFLVCIGIAIFEFIAQTRLTFYGVKTDATCVRIERVGVGRGERNSYTFRFTNEAGTAIEVKDIWLTEGTKVNDVIPIVYLPSNPEVISVAGIKGWGFLLFITTLAFLIGLFMWQWIR